MVRRLFLTPSSLPETIVKRLVGIPDDKDWYSLLNRALLLLADETQYEQVNETDLPAADVAAYWYGAYIEYLTDVCMNCCENLAEYMPLADGVLLAVNGGVAQQSFDGGTTWMDIPPDTGTPIVPPRIPAPGADDDARLCNASSHARDGLAEFYRQTYGVIAAGLANTLTDINRFLFGVNQSLFSIAFPREFQVLQAWDFFGDFPYDTHWNASTLSTEASDALLCLLLENASLSGGIVSFNDVAVKDGMIAAVGVNPGFALNQLIGYIGAAGLNRAGDMGSGVGDCAACDGTWCYVFDFAASDGGFAKISPQGSYVAGAGWRTALYTGVDGYRTQSITIKRTWAALVEITHAEVEFAASYGSQDPTGDAAFGLWANDFADQLVRVNVIASPTSPQTYDGGVTADDVTIQLLVGVVAGGGADPGGVGTITKLTLSGNGTNPFGGDNCP